MNQVNIMLVAALLATTSAGSAYAQQVQPGNEVQVQTQGEADLIDPIGGCKPKIKPTCHARIVCTGMAAIHGMNPRSVQVAMKIAQSNANAELVKYLGNKTKVTEEIKQLDRIYSKETGAGTETQAEFGQLISQVNSTSAEQFLQGVAVIGGKVDLSGGSVSVVIGQGCDSIAAAQAVTQRMQQGQAQQSGSANSYGQAAANGAPVMGGPQVHHGTPVSVYQRPTNDF